ncbi:MAG: MBL fold metallo-hydrolase [Candidatus Jordarchaeum sp.]|uniref:MBL fold metallo-hydrolase n=1 Tax=Candidatus Jordarchaeum sp. TaxID=2823881 RepID=UPI00404B0ABD
MRRILDDIHMFTLRLPFPATPELSVYYLEGGEPALIDTGLGDLGSMNIISSELHEIGRSLEDIAVIINTHEHIEHFGGNKKIKDASKAYAIASHKAAPIIENYHQHILDIKRNLVNAEFEFELKDMINRYMDFQLLIDESKVEKKVGEGDIINLGGYNLLVIECAGHALGHICLYDEDRKILFTGDHVIATGTTFVGYGWRELATRKMVDIVDVSNDKPDNMSLYLESLEKLQALDLKLILPAHGPPITDPYRKLREDIGRKMNRERVFLEVLKRHQEIALEDLTAEAYNVNAGNYLMQGAALGYLERLIKLGKITAKLKDNKLYFKIINL